MLRILTLGLVLFGSQSWAWEINRHDCESPGKYLESNAKGLSMIVTQFMPLFTTTDMLMPFGKPSADVNYVGIGIGVLKGFMQIGVTPVGTLNSILGFACIELVDK